MLITKQAPATEKHPFTDLIGEFYLDPLDSCDLLMRIAGMGDKASRVVVVQTIDTGCQRCWKRSGVALRPLVANFKANTLPRMRNALLAASDTPEQLRPGDVDRVLALAKDFGLAQTTMAQWLLDFELLPRTKARVEALAGLAKIVCPECQSNWVAGPDRDGFCDCTACGECFAPEDAHA